MTQTPNDQVSAFFDNEIDDAESELVLRRLTRDQSLRDRLSRYALISEAVRRDGPAPCNVAERVRAALDAEPALDAAAPAGAQGAQRFLRPLVGAAIAATVAMVAIGSLQSVPTGPTGDSGAAPSVIAQQGEPMPSNTAVTPVSAGVNSPSYTSPPTAVSYTVPSVMPVGRQSVAARRQLNSYLVSHSQYAKRMGPQNIVSFRAVGYRVPADAVPETTTDQPAVDNAQ
ncbi:MAG: sigma-E factor negative regulatory protein [Pseudomonadota bacterium]